MTNSSTTNTFANTTQVDCTVHHTCDGCLKHWACVWCPNVVEVGGNTNMLSTTTTTTTNVTLSSSSSMSSSTAHHAIPFASNTAHCAHFSNPLSKSAPLCPQWEYRVCGVAGWITLSVGAALVVLFLLALACLCWCCWCRGRCCNGGGKRRPHYRNMSNQHRRIDSGSNSSSASSYAGVVVSSGPMSSERRRLLADAADASSSPSFHSTPTPITDKRRRDMATKWGVGSSLTTAASPHLQTAAYSSEPSNAPQLDNVYFSSIN